MQHEETTFHLNYGLIGNCQISALVSLQGSIDWLCLPRFDSPSIFAKILDANQGGCFSIQPVESYTVQQHYLINTNILETIFTGDTWELALIDFCPRYFLNQQIRRPMEIHRILIPRKGTPNIRIHFEPQPDYARKMAQMSIRDIGIQVTAEHETLFLHSTLSLQMIMNSHPISLEGPSYLVMTYAFPVEEEIASYAENALHRTIQYWQTWIKHCSIPADYQDVVIRSALALKLHVFEDTGAIIAATTTSLPEILGTERCWDYRYCWLRDSYFVLEAFNTLAQFEELENYMLFLHNVCVAGIEQIQPLYGLAGETNLTEIRLAHLTGAGESGVVRIGNDAFNHKQYDVFGEMILAMLPLFFDQRLIITDCTKDWLLIKSLVEASFLAFPLKDNGIWEFRNDLRHHTFTKMMLWVAVDRGSKIAQHLKYWSEALEWQAKAAEMKAEILNRAWSETNQMFKMAYQVDEADASLLLMPILGLLEAQDPRFVATVQRYQQLLMLNGFVFRYVSRDDFGFPQNSFNLCTFWMIQALFLIGEEQEARRLFANMVACGNHLNLFSEDIHPGTKQLVGNFPQAYTHVGLILTARLLSRRF